MRGEEAALGIIVERELVTRRRGDGQRPARVVVGIALLAARRIHDSFAAAMGVGAETHDGTGSVSDRAQGAAGPLVARDAAKPVGGLDQVALRIVTPGPRTAVAIMAGDHPARGIVLVAH